MACYNRSNGKIFDPNYVEFGPTKRVSESDGNLAGIVDNNFKKTDWIIFRGDKYVVESVVVVKESSSEEMPSFAKIINLLIRENKGPYLFLSSLETNEFLCKRIIIRQQFVIQPRLFLMNPCI